MGITITFPDTPEVIEVLGQITGHANDDNVPFHEDEAEDAIVLYDDHAAADKHRKLAEAWAQVQRSIEEVLYGPGFGAPGGGQ